MKRLHTAVFGLSGNPPTENHALFIKHLLASPRYDLVRVVLSHTSPLKQSKGYLEPLARLELLNLLLDTESIDRTRCFIECLEIERAPPSYMIDTLKALSVMYPDEQRMLVLGLDGLKEFTTWYKWDEFGGLCQIHFYPRKDCLMSSSDIVSKLSELEAEAISAQYITEDVPMVAGSATEIRAYYQAGRRGIPKGMTAALDAMIRERGYYEAIY